MTDWNGKIDMYRKKRPRLHQDSLISWDIYESEIDRVIASSELQVGSSCKSGSGAVRSCEIFSAA